jgi:hypothetical protein
VRAGDLDGKRAFNLVLRRGVHRERSEGSRQLLRQRLRFLQVARVVSEGLSRISIAILNDSLAMLAAISPTSSSKYTYANA